ncbi:hypothetical protein HK102_000380 [Quaeritorhiza haematococci]|nr:hypothetical protein HK102_000380 [Quaeritorhiza haematococci]
MGVKFRSFIYLFWLWTGTEASLTPRAQQALATCDLGLQDFRTLGQLSETCPKSTGLPNHVYRIEVPTSPEVPPLPNKLGDGTAETTKMAPLPGSKEGDHDDAGDKREVGFEQLAELNGETEGIGQSGHRRAPGTLDTQPRRTATEGPTKTSKSTVAFATSTIPSGLHSGGPSPRPSPEFVGEPISSPSTSSETSRPTKQPTNHKTSKERFNYASFDCGALVMSVNSESKSSTSILKDNKDQYMLNKCSANKFVVVELCEDILVDTVALGNFEFFSSMFRDFTVSASSRYPPREKGWVLLGRFVAQNIRELQFFKVENPPIWARFIRIEFLTHYGREYYCPVSLLKVFGKTMMEDLADEEPEPHVGSSNTPFTDTVHAAAKKEKQAGGNIHTSPKISSLDPIIANHRHGHHHHPFNANELKVPGAMAPPKTRLHAGGGAGSHSTEMRMDGFSPISPLWVHQFPDRFYSFMASEPIDPQMGGDWGKYGMNQQRGLSDQQQNPNPHDGYLPASSTSPLSPSWGDPNSLTYKDLMANLFEQQSQQSQQQQQQQNQQAQQQPTGSASGSQESIFKTIMKRLSVLERNATLSYKYLEEQSKLFGDVFSQFDEAQRSRFASIQNEFNDTVVQMYLELEKLHDVWDILVYTVQEDRRTSEARSEELTAMIAGLHKQMSWLQFLYIFTLVAVLLGPWILEQLPQTIMKTKTFQSWYILVKLWWPFPRFQPNGSHRTTPTETPLDDLSERDGDNAPEKLPQSPVEKNLKKKRKRKRSILVAVASSSGDDTNGTSLPPSPTANNKHPG